MDSANLTLTPGAVIGERFRVEAEWPGDARGAFSGVEFGSGQQVLLQQLSELEAASLRPLADAHHAHLAQLLALLEEDGKTVGAFELVAGLSLDARLAELGKKDPVDAVRTGLRIADAVSALHQHGGAHGSLRPAAVVVDPADRGGPVVLVSVAEHTDYRSPERGDAGPPSEADDSWAVSGLLFSMLTGDTPPATGVESEEALVELVPDPVLRAALLHGLHADPAQRSRDLKSLKRELARWFVDHAGDDGTSHMASVPPPLPSSMPSPAAPVSGVATTTRPAAKPGRSKRLAFVLAPLAIVLGLVAAWAVSSFKKPTVEVVEVPPAASSSKPAASSSIDLSEVPVMAESEAGTGDQMATCVGGYLPKGAFGTAPDLDWICSEADPREGSGKLRQAVVSGAPTGSVTQAMKSFATLGWYEMAAFAVVRTGCCPDAKAMSLPEPSQSCGNMADALNELGRAVVNEKPLDEPLSNYQKVISCESGLGRSALYRRTGRPAGGEESAFRDLVESIQAR